jgi:hypothetical protein
MVVPTLFGTAFQANDLDNCRGDGPGARCGSYTTNDLNQYTQVGTEVLLYDDRGNLTSKGLSASYGYDSKNRSLSATVHVAGVSPEWH